MTQICVFNTRLFPCTLHLIMQYTEPVSEWNLTSLWIKPRERAFKQFKSPVLNVLIYSEIWFFVV